MVDVVSAHNGASVEDLEIEATKVVHPPMRTVHTRIERSRLIAYPADKIRRIRDFITKENWPEDKEACVLEDADCLVFLDTKLTNYLDAWEESKTLRILRRTLRKMTAGGRARALQLELGNRERELVRRAGLPAIAGSHPG